MCGVLTRYGGTMPERNSEWRPSSAGEAREYLDTHPLDGDPDIVAACEALFDARHHVADAAMPMPSDDQLEERGAD